MPEIIHKELSYSVRGVLLEVHKALGPSLPEAFYQEAVTAGLKAKGLECQPEKEFEVYYRQRRVGFYEVDVWIEGGKIILELKVAPQILPLHQAQALSYLKVTGADLAIVANFGAKALEDKRLPNFLRDKVVNLEWEQQPVSAKLPYSELISRLLQACHRVHVELGPGFLHQVYRRATMIELQQQGVSYHYIKQIPITYQGRHLGRQDVRLIAVGDKVLLATVAVEQVDETLKAKLQTRLKQLGFRLGLLVNFNRTTLEAVTVQTTAN